MNVRLPPTASLRALEAAARHLSYTRAAEELFITQSAVSHQIRHAEEIWKVRLFKRQGRRLILTPEGQELAPLIRNFLNHLETTLRDLKEEKDAESLKVSLLPSFALKWLVPRLGGFSGQHPELDVWISSSDEMIDFKSSDVDVAIRLGYGNWPELYSLELLREHVFPVCSPQFLDRMETPETAEDLLRYPLLYRHSWDICPRWRDWFRDAGIQVKSLPKGTRFQDTSMAVQAALDGQGIALARSAHVADDLAAGRLMKLLNVHSPSAVAYYIVCQRGRENLPITAAFIEWVLAEAEISQVEFDRVGRGEAPS